MLENTLLSWDRRLLKHVLLRGQSLIYLVAFASLYWQIPGLYGEHGLLPIAPKLECDVSPAYKCHYPLLVSLHRYLNLVPSRALQLVCLIGMLVAFATACYRKQRNALTYFVMYRLYLEVHSVGGIFLWYQWDSLLLESGFHMILLAAFSDSELDSIPIFLINWLACRLMFASGVVKLQSDCPAWWKLEALTIHYESQCVPTPIAWWFHQAPYWFSKLSTSLTFYIEIFVPLLFLLPLSYLRTYVFLTQLCMNRCFVFSAFLMVLIILTGNYNFFNFLIILICLALLEREKHVIWFSEYVDAVLSLVIGVVVTAFYMIFFNVYVSFYGIATEITFTREQFDQAVTKGVLFLVWNSIAIFVLTVLVNVRRYWNAENGLSPAKKFFHLGFVLGIGVPLFCASLVPFAIVDNGVYNNVPQPLKSLHEAVVPYNTINSYGLFRRMTGLNGRPEIIVEGAYDPNGPWREFRFYSKPGNVSEAPVFVLPHQPRLDWQMWFAALGSYQYNPFYINLVYHLMEGTPEVMRLMSKPQPFEVPPTFVRAKLYHYFYTKFGEEKDWWTRELQYEYMPIFNKGEQVVLEYLTKNRLVLSSEYSGGIFDFILSKLHGIVYETDQAIFVWGVLVATMLVIMTNFLYSIDLFSLLNSLQDYGI